VPLSLPLPLPGQGQGLSHSGPLFIPTSSQYPDPVPPTEEELVQEYREYLERFDAAAGSIDFGAFFKHNGRLVKKLRYDEFVTVYTEYSQIARSYFESMDRGDTINDVIVKIVRDRANELLKTSPV